MDEPENYKAMSDLMRKYFETKNEALNLMYSGNLKAYIQKLRDAQTLRVSIVNDLDTQQ